MIFNIQEKVRIVHDHYGEFDQNRNCSIQGNIGIIVSRYTSNDPFMFYGWQTTGINRYLVRLADNQNYLVREEDLIKEYEREYEGTMGYYKESVQLEQKNKGIIMKLNSMMRRLLNADVKKLIKAGLMNGDLLLTEEGKNAVYAILVEAHKKELVEIAKEIIEEQKEEN